MGKVAKRGPRQAVACVLTFLIFVLVLCAVGYSPASLGASQGTSQESAANTTLRSSTEIVKIDVGVLDQRGQFVAGLKQSDFRVLDEGIERPIVFFAPVDAPSRVLVLVETGPAVYLIHTEHLSALYALLDGLAQDDEIGLATYDQTLRSVLPFTKNRSSLLSGIDAVQYTIGMGELNFYDAVSSCLDWMNAGSGKTSLLVLTTGLDSSPASHWDNLAQKARKEGAVIFAVGLGASLRGKPLRKSRRQGPETHPGNSPGQSDANSAFEKADAALNMLAAMTGGQAYFPDSSAAFAPAYREIAAALRNQYVLGINAAADGRFHRLTVEVPPENPRSAAPNRILVREGYLAPQP